jgi:hypothetical protein
VQSLLFYLFGKYGIICNKRNWKVYSDDLGGSMHINDCYTGILLLLQSIRQMLRAGRKAVWDLEPVL